MRLKRTVFHSLYKSEVPFFMDWIFKFVEVESNFMSERTRIPLEGN